MSSDPIEIEVKFFLKTPQEIDRRLRSLGAQPKAKVFEINTCFDDSQNRIAASDQLLRLRQTNDCKLTVKCKPETDDPDVKVYKELEVQVSDYNTMKKILYKLGYRPVRRYEKWRQSYILGNAKLCMDTLPFGDFLEIEADKTTIRQTAEGLGLIWEKRILTNYLTIFDRLQKKAHLTFNNPTFEHFKGLAVSIEPFIEYFEAGL